MNIIKNLFTDLENLLNLLNNFDYTKLLLLTIILAIIYLINIILVNKYYKPRMGLFKNLCQAGKITNTKGHTDEYRDRC